jgi:cystathionine gamma-synthase
MAAAGSVFDLFAPGSVVVASKFSYTGVAVRLGELAERGIIELRLADVTDNADLASKILPSDEQRAANWVWIETPTNPMLEICDIRKTAEVAHSVDAYLAVDNTFMTPARQNPIALGADFVMHSVTKGLAGHSDLLMGAIVVSDPELHHEIVERRVLLGAIPSAFDAFLALRGIRTLHVRIDRAEANARELAARLASDARVSRVHYPELPTQKNADIHAKQASGPGFVISFEVAGTPDDAERVTKSVRLATHATSLGGVETLIERRRRWPKENSEVPENLIRMSVGIENVEDIWNDLSQALNRIGDTSVPGITDQPVFGA